MCARNKYSSNELVNFIKNKKEKYWLKVGKENMLNLFKFSAKNIPAYKDFLKKNKVDPLKIKNLDEFKKLPGINKNSYLKNYDLEKISCTCLLIKPAVFTSTSGSTGSPFYFPRGNNLDWQCSVIKNLFLKNGMAGQNNPVLVIIGFGMGVWIGGLITYKAFEIASQENSYPVSIITPGINKLEIFNALKNLSPHYKQTILVGYPPFIKDIIDEAPKNGIDLKSLNIRLIFAAESFTEKFRDYIAEKAGVKNIYLDTLNIYGSADIGAMAFETPLSILVRRLALKNKKLFREIFSEINKTPTLVQYIPHFINFEEQNGELFLTGNNIIPLVRYAIGDHGGVLTFSEVKEKFAKHGFNLKKEMKKAGISDYIYELPFVYVYERADFSLKLRLRDIYPEFIKDALMHKTISKYLTGKFTMETKYNKQQNQYLEVNLEMKKDKNINAALKKLVYKEIEHSLCGKSSGPGGISEFKKGSPLLKLFFWPAEDERYFKPGAKQKWTEKEVKSMPRVLARI